MHYTAVFYLFGKASPSPLYAIHEEDALEFPYTLQAGRQPEDVLRKLRSSNLLLLGCTFADWLSRFFIRMSNSDRLFSDQRAKKEFLIGKETTRDRNFSMFIERFSRDTRCCATDAKEFVRELYRRWSERNPQITAQPENVPTAETTGDIFVSYSRKTSVQQGPWCLSFRRSAGLWFGSIRLFSLPATSGTNQIRTGIKKCSLFVPLISATTERRMEGYFRREWDEAVERSRRIQGRKFVMPVDLDPQYHGSADDYRLVPDRFRDFHFGHAPGGILSEDLKRELILQVREISRARAL